MMKPLFKSDTVIQCYVINNKLFKCIIPIQSVSKCIEFDTVYYTGKTVYRCDTPSDTPLALDGKGLQAKCIESVSIQFDTVIHFQL